MLQLIVSSNKLSHNFSRHKYDMTLKVHVLLIFCSKSYTKHVGTHLASQKHHICVKVKERNHHPTGRVYYVHLQGFAHVFLQEGHISNTCIIK